MIKPLLTTLLVLAVTGCNASGTAQDQASLTVYKSPQCGCCNEWVNHVEDHGFEAQSKRPEQLRALKLELGVDMQHASCHTAVTESGYVFEGHIPAPVMKRFLDNPPPDALGLAVPRMPVGSPGMEMGERFEPYEVLLLTESGEHRVFARINQPEDQR